MIRQAWDGDPDNGGTVYVEVPPGVWVEAWPGVYEHYDVRLDPDMCDPYPEDLEAYRAHRRNGLPWKGL